MNTFAFVKMLKSMPRVDANQFEETNFIVKTRNEYKNEIFNSCIGIILSIVVFFVLSRVPVIGPFFFIAGFTGFLISIQWLYSSIYVYRHYYDLFSEDVIKKLIDKENSKK